ncbi:MAG TPA: 3-dehydroquinate synthase [Aggregatilineaceae bacterium]|nr:3-dehydroquinate synthase [Aggregatilineaceae bacterium]
MEAARKLTVRGADGSYSVHIGPRVLVEELPRFVSSRSFTRVAVVTNTTLAPLYGEALAARLPNSFLIPVPDGEEFKTLDTVNMIYANLLEGGADRSSVVICLGGGVIGDMAGFAAATYMRGVSFIQAPTSLLAMVDASIGGKVGVDLPQGKNLVGAFKDPLAVFADTATLHTLPDVEKRCGLAEALKSALVGDPALFDQLVERGPEPLVDTIERAAAVKVKIVSEDRLEKGTRAFLNLGHTFGHALELVSNYTWRHGEAVALGLAAAVRLSAYRKLCDSGLVETVELALMELNLPVHYRDFAPATLWEAMVYDKKWHGGTAKFVLMQSIGEPVIAEGVTREEVLRVLHELRES